jgi:hypothetical protein
MRVHRNAKTTPKMRQLIVTRVHQGWTYARIAAALGISARTVAKWIDPPGVAVFPLMGHPHGSDVVVPERARQFDARLFLKADPYRVLDAEQFHRIEERAPQLSVGFDILRDGRLSCKTTRQYEKRAEKSIF